MNRVQFDDSPTWPSIPKGKKFNGKSEKSDKCHLILDLLSRRTDKSSEAYDFKLPEIWSIFDRSIPSSICWLKEDETMNALKYRNYTKIIKKSRILWSKWRNHEGYSQNWNVRYYRKNQKVDKKFKIRFDTWLSELNLFRL